MKRFETLLLEKELTPVQQKAQELGLKYRGFGYWQDPKTGKTAYKTEGDDLVPIDDEKQMELDDEEDGLGMGNPLGQQDPEGAPQLPPGSNVLGAPEPGQERPPTGTHDESPTETGWDAGPDGDNMVNDQDKPEDDIPTDTYVGANNNFSWVAGPDGSNFKNLSFDKLIDEALHCLTEVNRSKRTQGVKDRYSQLNTDGAQVVARARRHGKERDGGTLDGGHTAWWAPDWETNNARKFAKGIRDKQQRASNAKKGDPMEKTSYWKGEGYKTGTAQGKARDIRHLPTNSKTKDNKTKFWKDKGFDQAEAEDLAKGARDGELSTRNDGLGFGAPNNPVPTEMHDEIMQLDDHDKAMEDLLGLLTKNKPIANKGYTGAETQIQNLQNKDGGRTERNAALAMDKLSPTEQDKQMKSLERLANQPSAPGKTNPKKKWIHDPTIDDRQRARDVQHRLRDLPKRPQQKKDEERVKKMNEDLRDLLSDPNIDLNYEDLRELGSGAFGSAYLSKDKNHVIKDGKIGSKELKVLHKLKDSPYFPKLLNAAFRSPFSNQSSVRNNPYGASDMARSAGQENYPLDESEDWAGPTADGSYAMSTAKGGAWANARNSLYGDEKSQRVANIWRAREALHRAGVSHNDMHASNVFVDDEGNPTILDLGLANDDPMSALQEALAGYTDQDYQMARAARFEDLPRDLQDRMGQNIRGVTEKMRDRLKIMTDPSDDGYDWDTNHSFDEFLRGGIRLKDDQLKEMREKFDFSDEEIMDYISQIYDGLTPKEQSELEKRMSAAYDKRVTDSEVMGDANAVRKNKGRPPLDFKHVVPSKNLDKSSTSFNWDD